MKRYFTAMCWAIAMLALAWLARIGWVEREAATTLLLVMPILAWVTIQGRGRCNQRGFAA